jgi:glycosyltransferase involved in cell wall biosynthesis
MRYAWFWREEIRRFPRWLRPIWPLAAACFRAADRRWAARVNAFVANSHHVAGRIRTAYGRDATVVYPPIETDYWTPAPHTPTRSYFLFAGRLVPYKRPHVAVAAANVARVPLVVAGSGPELPRLRAIAGDTVRFVPAPDDTELRELYRHARALIHPGIEDFGMTLVEAQACGTPVIARDAGGAREAVVNGRTGILYAGETEQELADILASFDCERFSTPELRAHAEQFDSRIFDRRIRMVIRDALSTHSGLG